MRTADADAAAKALDEESRRLRTRLTRWRLPASPAFQQVLVTELIPAALARLPTPSGHEELEWNVGSVVSYAVAFLSPEVARPLAKPLALALRPEKSSMGVHHAHILDALESTGHSSVVALPEAKVCLAKNDLVVFMAAARALGRMGEAGGAVLIEQLPHIRADWRVDVASALVDVDPFPPKWFPLVTRMIDEETDARVASMLACIFLSLAEDRVDISPVIPYLKRKLRAHRRSEVTEALISTVHFMGPRGAPMVPELSRLLDTTHRVSAILALGKIGAAAAPTLPLLDQYAQTASQTDRVRRVSREQAARIREAIAERTTDAK